MMTMPQVAGTLVQMADQHVEDHLSMDDVKDRLNKFMDLTVRLLEDLYDRTK